MYCGHSDSAVASTLTGRPGNRSSIVGRGKVSSFYKESRQALEQNRRPVRLESEAFYRGVKQAARQADNSKNLWSYYSASTPVFMEWYLINSSKLTRTNFRARKTRRLSQQCNEDVKNTQISANVFIDYQLIKYERVHITSLVTNRFKVKIT